MLSARSCAVALLSLLLFASLAPAQPPGAPGPGDTESEADKEAAAAGGAASCAMCGGCMIFGVIAAVAAAVVNILLLVWVAKDAKARGMDSGVVWMILVMFTGVIGLLIYILSRPQGNLIKCDSCGNNRMEASRLCPHCGNA